MIEDYSPQITKSELYQL